MFCIVLRTCTSKGLKTAQSPLQHVFCFFVSNNRALKEIFAFLQYERLWHVAMLQSLVHYTKLTWSPTLPTSCTGISSQGPCFGSMVGASASSAWNVASRNVQMQAWCCDHHHVACAPFNCSPNLNAWHSSSGWREKLPFMRTNSSFYIP